VQPRQSGTPVTEQSKVDFRANFQSNDISQSFFRSCCYPPHFFEIVWPLLTYRGFELESGGLDLSPREFCGLEKEIGVKGYAALDLLGGLETVLVSYLVSP
jgi:hypothetical protein